MYTMTVYDSLCQDIDKEVVESLIEYNVIHVRPYFKLYNDINPPPKPSQAIINRIPLAHLIG